MNQKAVLKMFEGHVKRADDDVLSRIDLRILCDNLKRDGDYQVEWIETGRGTVIIPHDRLRRHNLMYVYDTMSTTKHPDGRNMAMLISKKEVVNV